MADISKITLPSGTSYNIKDAQARTDIANIQTSITGGIHYIGETTTALSNGSQTNPVKIDGNDVTATSGDLVTYGNLEFIFSDVNSKWHEFGSTGSLKALAFKDNTTATYTPAGSVSQPSFTGSSTAVSFTIADNTSGNYQPKGSVSKPSFTGNSLTSSGKFTPEGTISLSTGNKNTTVSAASSGTATYTPAGSVAAPSISVATAGSTTTVNSITAVGTLPSFSATVSNENLTLGFNQGTLPTKGSNVTVKTGDASYSASAPAFTGTGVRLVTGNIAVPTGASFTGTEGDVSVSGTPSGSVSQPSFTGTKVQISGSTTAAGTVSKPTFSGTQATITGT